MSWDAIGNCKKTGNRGMTRRTRSRVLRQRNAEDESSNLDAHLQLPKANKQGKIGPSCPRSIKSLIMKFIGLPVYPNLVVTTAPKESRLRNDVLPH